MAKVVLAVSCALQLVALALALRQGRRSLRHLGWSLLALAAVGMLTRGMLSVHAAEFAEPPRALDPVTEWIALASALCIVVGCFLIQPRSEHAGENETRFRGKKMTPERLLELQFRELQHLYDKTPVGLALLDAEMRFLRINEELARMSGVSSEEHLGRTPGELGRELGERIEPILRHVLETGETVAGLEIELPPTGTRTQRAWSQGSYFPIKTPAGELAGVSVVVLDVTERKEAERASRLSEARKGAILEAALESIISIDETGRIVDFNAAAEATFGYARDKAIGQELSELIIPPFLRALQRESLQKYLATGQGTVMGKRIEMPALHADGSIFPVELTVTRVPVEGLMLFTAYLRDLRESKRTQGAILDRESRLRAVVSTAVDAILTIDEKGVVETVNPAAERLFGFAAHEVIGRNVKMLMPSPYQDEHDGYLDRYLETDEKRIIGIGREVTGLRKNGTTFPLHLTVSEMTVGGRRMFTGIARDITQLKETEHALQARNEDLSQSNKELEQFAYVASHDLQEPLRMVASFTQLLARRYRGRLDPEADEFIGYAVDGVKRMQAQIEGLLTLSRVGSRGESFGPVDLDAVLGEALRNLTVVLAESRAEVTHDPLPTVRADARQMVNLLQNLVGNAVKFHGERSPRVHLTAAREGSRWRVSVRDNGIGIASQGSDRLFVIFQRLHTREKYPGTGIGLALCKKIVERHGGKIWYESVPGEGTTFHFTLPERR